MSTPSAHPYLFYEAIQQQPDRIAKFLSTRRALVEEAAAAAAPRHRIVLLGIGSSHHAAQIGEYFLRHFNRASTAIAEQSFEQVHYPRGFHPNDIAIFLSHRGTNNHTMQAMTAARTAGAFTLGICCDPPSPDMLGADFAIPTCELETCFVHTKAYTTALAALALFAVALIAHRKQIDPADGAGATASLHRLPDLIRQTLTLEPQLRDAAKIIAKRDRWIFIGTGPNWATARDGVRPLNAALLASLEQEAARLHPDDARLDDFARKILEVAASSPGLDEQRLRNHLVEHGFSDVLEGALAARGWVKPLVPWRDLPLDEAERVWRDAFALASRVALRQDLAAAVAECADARDREAWNVVRAITQVGQLTTRDQGAE